MANNLDSSISFFATLKLEAQAYFYIFPNERLRERERVAADISLVQFRSETKPRRFILEFMRDFTIRPTIAKQ